MSTDRWAWAEIDLDALAHNVGLLRAAAAPADVWAVVKADGYGHGAVPVAQRALRAGATGLCVALTAEGVALREAGLDAPILVLSEQPPGDAEAFARHHLIATAYTVAYVDALAAASTQPDGVAVHVKVDTGMQRVGAAPNDALSLVERVHALAPALRCDGVYTHLACADDPQAEANTVQLAAFDRVIDEINAAGLLPPRVHAANSAAALALPDARRSLVRAGIALYGISPGAGVDHLAGGLLPALSLRARVSYLKRVRAGSHVSYGWRHRVEHDTTLATVPIGYADGVARRLGTLPDQRGADVLVGGARCPIVGVVTMDQLVVDVGDRDVRVGDEVVLLGSQGDDRIRAEDWAARLGTIGYEIMCAISARVPRVHTGR